MKTTSVDPLIPRHATNDATLTRLFADITALTGLMNDAERMSCYSLAAMFNRARDAKVAQAEDVIALVTVVGEELADDRRFLLVRGVGSMNVAPVLPRQKPARSPVPLALTV